MRKKPTAKTATVSKTMTSGTKGATVSSVPTVGVKTAAHKGPANWTPDTGVGSYVIWIRWNPEVEYCAVPRRVKFPPKNVRVFSNYNAANVAADMMMEEMT